MQTLTRIYCDGYCITPSIAKPFLKCCEIILHLQLATKHSQLTPLLNKYFAIQKISKIPSQLPSFWGKSALKRNMMPFRFYDLIKEG